MIRSIYCCSNTSLPLILQRQASTLWMLLFVIIGSCVTVSRGGTMPLTRKNELLLQPASLRHTSYFINSNNTDISRELVSSGGDNCILSKEFATPYNENPNGHLIAGIMFTVRSLEKAITIKTLEIDVNIDKAGTDLAIEVYTALNGYTSIFNVASSWTLQASTNVVPVPGSTTGSVLIPVQEFTKFTMQPNELRSFYITMKSAYIESTVNALVQSGEIYMSDVAIQIDVGSAFATYKFPSSYDTTIAPQFAGIIHYVDTTPIDGCTDTDVQKLSIDYKFLVNASSFDQTITTTVNQETKVFFEEQLEQEDGYLREYKLKYQLAQNANPTSEASERPLEECPATYTTCAEIAVSASFEHSDGIESDTLLYILYSMEDTLRGQIKRGIDKMVTYAGKEARSASFKFTWDNVPTAILNAAQKEYVEDFTKTFTSDSIPDTLYEVVIQDQELNGESITVMGEVRGSAIGTTPQSFADNIANALRTKNSAYLEGLAFNVLRPTSTLDKIDASYFQDIASFRVEMIAILPETSAPTPAPSLIGAPTSEKDKGGVTNDIANAASNAGSTTMIIVAVITVICICIAVIIGYICCKWNKKDVLDLKTQSKLYSNMDENEDDESPTRAKSSMELMNASSGSLVSFDSEEKPSLATTKSSDIVSSRNLSASSSTNNLGKSVDAENTLTQPPLRNDGLKKSQSLAVGLSGSRVVPSQRNIQRAKSDDGGIPLPSRNVGLRRMQSAAIVNSGKSNSTSEDIPTSRNEGLKKAQSSATGLNSTPPRLSSVLDSRPKAPQHAKSVSGVPMSTGTVRLDSLLDSQPKQMQHAKSISGDVLPSRPRPPQHSKSSIERSHSGDGLTRPKPFTALDRSKSDDDNDGRKMMPLPSFQRNVSDPERGVDRSSSGMTSGATRVPPLRTNSPRPNTMAANVPSTLNGQQQRLTPQRTVSSPVQGNSTSTSGQSLLSTTPQRVAPQRAPSPPPQRVPPQSTPSPPPQRVPQQHTPSPPPQRVPPQHTPSPPPQRVPPQRAPSPPPQRVPPQPQRSGINLSNHNSHNIPSTPNKNLPSRGENTAPERSGNQHIAPMTPRKDTTTQRLPSSMTPQRGAQRHASSPIPQRGPPPVRSQNNNLIAVQSVPNTPNRQQPLLRNQPISPRRTTSDYDKVKSASPAMVSPKRTQSLPVHKINVTGNKLNDNAGDTPATAPTPLAQIT